jgi:hypothetical protein
VFQEEETTSLADHRETSQVTKINTGHCSVWLRREEGSNIFLHKENIAAGHLERFLELRIDDWVYHGVDSRAGKWGATNAECFSREENEKLRRGESLDTEPEPQPLPDPDTVLATSTRSTPILQLILERRKS